MGSLFTTADRESIKEYIIALARESGDILSAVLVGSGTAGFTDALSDLDFYMVVNREENIGRAMVFLSAGIKKQLPILYFDQIPQRSLQVYLTGSYLEIDIGYASADSVSATRQNWKVLFDKAGSVDFDMKKSWVKNEEKQRNESHRMAMKEKYAAYADDTWHYLFHAAVAAKRGRCWRCAGEMEIARGRLIELKGLKHSLVTKRCKGVDDFPEDELAVLRNTFPTAFSKDALFASLDCLVDAVYDELEAVCEKELIPVNRRQVKEYISQLEA